MISLLLSLALAAPATAQTAPCAGGTIESRAKAGCVATLTPAPGLAAQGRAAPASDAPAPPQEWKVFDRDGRLALVFIDKPGPLTSGALESGGPPSNNPFLSGSARDPGSENSLRELLDASRGVRDFIARLQKAGYRVEKSAPPPVIETAKVAPGSQWEVLKDSRAVLRLINTPGPLFSTAMPPPGVEPPNHPFLSGSALDAAEEGALRRLLDASRDTADFLVRLRRAGYVVRPQTK